MEKELGYKFIRINPDTENYDVSTEIGKIHNYIAESTKKSLIDNVSKRLLELEFKSDHLIKSKVLKYVVNKILPWV